MNYEGLIILTLLILILYFNRRCDIIHQNRNKKIRNVLLTVLVGYVSYYLLFNNDEKVEINNDPLELGKFKKSECNQIEKMTKECSTKNSVSALAKEVSEITGNQTYTNFFN